MFCVYRTEIATSSAELHNHIAAILIKISKFIDHHGFIAINGRI